MVKIVDLRDGTTNVDSAMLPIATNGTEVDYAQLNSQAYADLIGMKDPADTSANPGQPDALPALRKRASSTRCGAAWPITPNRLP